MIKKMEGSVSVPDENFRLSRPILKLLILLPIWVVDNVNVAAVESKRISGVAWYYRRGITIGEGEAHSYN